MIVGRPNLWADLNPKELQHVNNLLANIEQIAKSPTTQSARRLRTILLDAGETIQHLLDGADL